MKDAVDSSNVSITIFDKKNDTVKTFSKDAKEKSDQITFAKGMNQFVWDMQYAPVEKIDGMILWNGTVSGPKVAPGKYKARFRFDKDSTDVPFTILGDPNYKMTEKDYDDQVDFLLKVKGKFADVQQCIKDIRNIRGQLNDYTSKIDTAGTKDIRDFADSINKKMTAIEEALYQTKAKSGQDILNFPIRLNDKIAGLYNYANSGYNPPSKQAIESYNDLAGQADTQLAKFKDIQNNELKQFNQMIHDKKLPVIAIKKG